MLKESEVIPKLKILAEEILSKVSNLKLINLDHSIILSSRQLFQADIALQVKSKSNRLFTLVFEIKSLGQPRYVRLATSHLKEMLAGKKNIYGIVGAPFLSEESKNICIKEGFGYLDLVGNCLFQFDNIFVHIDGKPNPHTTTRPLKSIFSPKTTRALRILLTFPRKAWQVKTLAQEAKLSLGQISNLKKRLLDYEWIEETENRRFHLKNPEGLLNQWAKNYSYQKNKIHSFYTLSEPDNFEDKFISYLDQHNIQYALALFSGAARVAPFMRFNRVFFYIQGSYIEQIVNDLQLKKVFSGANVILLEPYDEGIFYATQNIDSTKVISDIQLYLDLKSYPGRGEEAAEFIFNERLRKKWQVGPTIINKP